MTSIAQEPGTESRSISRDGSPSRPVSRAFWQLWSANSLSNLGDGLYQFSLPLLAIRLTDSPAQVAGVSFALALAWPLFALLAGSIVDRVDRRALMQVVNLARIGILAALTAAIVTGSASLALLYAAALLLGIGETLVDTALTSVVRSLVPRERLDWANGRITAAATVTNTFIGPPLAGYLAGLGLALATGASMGMYVTAGAALLLMGGRFQSVPVAGTVKESRMDIASHLTAGLRFLWRDHLIRDLTLFTAAMNLFWGGWAAVFVLYAVAPGAMGLTQFEYGLLLTGMAVGGVLGSLLSERIQRKLGTRGALALDMIGTAALLGVPALTTNALAVGAATLLAGLGAAVWVVIVASVRQRLVPDALLGRVYSASRLISWGVMPLGAALAGLVAELWSVRVMFAVGGVVNFGLLFVFMKTVRLDPRSGGD